MLPVTKSKTRVPHTYTLHRHTLQEVSSTKYRGVTLQSDTRFSHHLDGTVTKANRTLAFLRFRRNLKIGSTKAKDLVYKSLVRPLLESASTVWDPSTKKDILRIAAVQRPARFVIYT